jgi:hypothetical protein
MSELFGGEIIPWGCGDIYIISCRRVIDPIQFDNALSPPPINPSHPKAYILVHLPNGKHLMVKLNYLHSIAMLEQHIASAVEGQYVMTLEYPPRTIENLEFGG